MAKGVKRGKASKSDGGAPDVAEGKTAAESVAERAMPGWSPQPTVRTLPGRGRRGNALDGGPSSEIYGSVGADASAPPAPTKMLGDKVEVVEMKSGDLQKSVGVNAETEKVEWSQG